MEITDIEYNSKSVKITTDGNYSFIVDIDTTLEYPLDVGRELSEEEITEIIYYDMTRKAKVAALKFISRRLRSEKEIRDYIRGKGYDKIVEDNVICDLHSYGYIDDGEFAKSFVRDRVNLKKQGRERLIYELKLKGIGDEDIANAVGTLAIRELPNAVSILRDKYKSFDFKERRRMINLLKRKGYSYDIINQALRVIENE